MLTVEESLLYSARLRLPLAMPDSEKIDRVRISLNANDR